jgi:uncharacterized protein (TIGR03083 family)
VNATQYADHIEIEGHALVAAAASAGLEAPVPTCPGWTVTDLLRHITFVHRWATRYLVEELTEMQPHASEEEILHTGPTGDDLLTYVASGVDALVEAVRAASPNLECWTFMRTGSPRDQWARRQAHETTIHRADAELAAMHTITTVTTDFATDGIDELLGGFMSRDLTDEPCGTIGIRPTDGGTTWAVELSESRARGRPNPDTADVWIDDSSSDLYFALWHRGELQNSGDTRNDGALLELWNKRGIRW